VTNSAQSPNAHRAYLRYSDNVEQPLPDEEELIGEVVEALHRNNEWAFKKYQHAIRDAHAKSHGCLRGELTVYPDLPEYLRQGLFAIPATYPVIARVSSTHPAIRSDQIRGIRAIAIKVLGVQGPRVLPDDTANTQDFVLVNHSEFPYADVRAYRTKGMRAAKMLARAPGWLLWLGTELLAAVARVLAPFGVKLPMEIALFTAANTHILGQTFHSAAPLRYGDYIAKVSLAPLSASVTRLQGQRVPLTAGFDAHRDSLVNFFNSNSAEYEVRAQLCTDAAAMPIEDATKAWSESVSPPIGVAKVTFGIQDAGTPERRVFADDVLSFNSWRGLADHRPLGSINRLKKRTYDASSQFRHQMNNAPRIEPADITELPK
jgi:hypothetical protein